MAKTRAWITLGRGSISFPADWQTVYLRASTNDSNTQSRIQIPIDSVIVGARVTLRVGGLGSAELWTAHLNIDGAGSQHLITNAMIFNAENFTASIKFNIPVTTVNYINIQLTFPTRVTNPTSVVVSGSVLIEF